jgi:hypothetical protein
MDSTLGGHLVQKKIGEGLYFRGHLVPLQRHRSHSRSTVSAAPPLYKTAPPRHPETLLSLAPSALPEEHQTGPEATLTATYALALSIINPMFRRFHSNLVQLGP